MQQNTICVGLLGLGTVGTGVVRILQAHRDKIKQVVGKEVVISKILVRDIKWYLENTDSEPSTLTTHYDDILYDDSIDMVVEVMGSIETAKEYIIKALENKKHVVTANKDLIALYGDELMQLARQNHCDLYYEASVGGGIPILRTLANSMASDQIKEIIGIVNGTTNYMLTKMEKNHWSYDEALKQAQELGFAEVDPTSDVDGLDAARKMVILTRLAFGMHITLKDITIEGIRHIEQQDMINARQWGYSIKLLGFAKLYEDKVYIEVSPTLISQKHPLAHVNNENNAIYVVGSAVGETMYYGPGAGELPTANSVVSDIINISKNMLLQTNGNILSTYQNETALVPKEDVLFQYYYRLNLADIAGNFLELTKIFANYQSSFERIRQEQVENGIASVMIITHPMSVFVHEKIKEAILKNPQMELKLTLRVMEN